MKIHPSITTEVIMEAVERQMFGDEDPGFCIKCGFEQDGCEPDACRYKCEVCGERAVYGAQELLLMTVA